MKKKKKNILEVKKLTDFFAKDWLLKFISLVMAVVLWYFVGGEDRIDKNVMVPIEIINLPRDLVISNQFKKEIEVTVSGPRTLIMDMANKSVTRQVDLSAATPGTMVIENDNDHIPVPRGVTVQRVQPSSIILSLDKLIQKQFPVTPRTTGQIAHGYRLANLKTDPEVITITGPQTTLSQVDELYTKTVNLEGLKQSQQIQVPLELEPTIVELIGETSVTVDIEVVADTETRTLEGMELNNMVGGTKVEVEPPRVDVVVKIPKLLLEQQVDPRTLLSLSLIRDETGGKFKVLATPRPSMELPIEVVAIIPPTVQAVRGDIADLSGAKKGSAAALAPMLKKEEPKAVTQHVEEDGGNSETGQHATNVLQLKRSKEKRIISEE